MLEPRRILDIGLSDLFRLGFTVIVGSEEDRAEEPSVDGALVQHDGVFLVVARIASNGDNGVAPSSQLFELQVLHGFA